MPEELRSQPMQQVHTALAPLLAESRISSGQLSQLLRGQRVTVLERKGDWMRVCGWDSYEGWLHAGYTGVARDFAGTVSLGCSVRHEGRVMQLPVGALLLESDVIVSGETFEAADRATRFPIDATAVCASAQRFFAGAPYEWGGVSPWGADCSGLVQAVFGLHGISLPRDSPEQGAAGSAASVGVADAAAGDLLFFSEREDGRITHVGIALGDGRMLHSALGRGGYAVEDFRVRKDDAFVALLSGRFRFARRVI